MAVRGLAFALALNAVYTVFEAVIGLSTGSLALLADAGHNLSDVFALTIALGASWLAQRPPTAKRSFGFKRAEILAAFINALSLVVIALVIGVEAIRRIGNPPDVPGGWLIVVAAIGILINGAGAAALVRGSRDNLNLRASFIHLAGDALGSALVIVAGIIILTTGFEQADTIASFLLAILILASAWGVLRDSTAILMEQTPDGIEPDEVRDAILSVEGVKSFHDLHVWTISSGFDALAAHVLVAQDEDCHRRRRDIEAVLAERFDIEHTTLQVDHVPAEVIQISRRTDSGGEAAS
jgi:cobalt-zinc-cadmium efflux system protein